MRLSDWPERLSAAVEAAQRTPFAWGSHDCATWACDVAAQLAGTESHAEKWRGTYTTGRGSVRRMRQLGWRDLAEMGDDLFGERVPPLVAQRGDVALAEGAFGVVLGQSVAVLVKEGLSTVPLRTAEAVWSV